VGGKPHSLGVATWKTKSYSQILLALVRSERKVRLHRMERTMVDFSTCELFIAARTLKSLQLCIQFPEDFSPGHQFLSQIHNEFVDIKIAVAQVLSNDSSVVVDKDLSLWTHHPLLLTRGV